MYPPSRPYVIDNSITDPGLGAFGSAATVSALQKGLTEVSRWMQRGEYNPGRDDGVVDIWTANAVLNVIDDALREIPGFDTLVNGLGPAWDLMTSRAGILAAWLAFESQISTAISHIANALAPLLKGIVEVLVYMRQTMGNFEAVLSKDDIVRAAKHALGMLSEFPAPSELVPEDPVEAGPPGTVPPSKMRPRAQQLPTQLMPTGVFPKEAFAVHDPVKNAYRVLVRT